MFGCLHGPIHYISYKDPFNKLVVLNLHLICSLPPPKSLLRAQRWVSSFPKFSLFQWLLLFGPQALRGRPLQGRTKPGHHSILWFRSTKSCNDNNCHNLYIQIISMLQVYTELGPWTWKWTKVLENGMKFFITMWNAENRIKIFHNHMKMQLKFIFIWLWKFKAIFKYICLCIFMPFFTWKCYDAS